MSSRPRRFLAALLAAIGIVTSVAVASTERSDAIVGGFNAPADVQAFTAEIVYQNFAHCTGSLIDPWWVLTAVHCVETINPPTVSVRVGNAQRGTGGELIPVKEIRRNPNYAGGPDDVALLRLQWPARSRPIPLADSSDIARWDGVNSDYTNAVGWGYTTPGANLASTLQMTGVRLMPDTGDAQGNMRIWLDDGLNSRGPCQGDSGGPLIITATDGRYKQVGVAKAANCTGGGWYSEVGAGPNRDWIRTTLFNAGPDWEDPNTIYGISPNGDLRCYVHQGYSTGSPRYTNGTGVVVGNGWQGFKQVWASSGAIYGVDPAGDVWWYRHTGASTCSTAWTGRKVVRHKWGGYTKIFGMTVTSGQGGVMYTVDKQGRLRWFRHKGYVSGQGILGGWEGGTIVGTGWNGLTIIPGENGEMYTVNPANGDLIEHRHLGYRDGTATWAAQRVVGRRWETFRSLVGAGDGVIYAIQPDGTARWYRHIGHASGSLVWQGPFTVGYGWTGFKSVFLNSPMPERPIG